MVESCFVCSTVGSFGVVAEFGDRLFSSLLFLSLLSALLFLSPLSLLRTGAVRRPTGRAFWFLVLGVGFHHHRHHPALSSLSPARPACPRPSSSPRDYVWGQPPTPTKRERSLLCHFSTQNPERKRKTTFHVKLVPKRRLKSLASLARSSLSVLSFRSCFSLCRYSMSRLRLVG